jgi:23S rRNA pseudouridine1911/1915/1917 synthase
MKEETVRTVVEAEEARDLRIDTYISEYLELFSRSQVKKRVISMELNGAAAKPSTRIAPGDRLSVRYRAAEPLRVTAEPLQLRVLFENEDVLVVDKPQGMVVHPAAGHFTGTLVNGLLHHVRGLAEEFADEQLRPGIVHRLDKDTSGVLITARHKNARDELSGRFAAREVEKRYLALVKGSLPEQQGRILHPISRDPNHRQRFTWKQAGGKEAETGYRVLQRYSGYTLVLLHPRTGRTHQLRVHMASLAAPVLGDPVYGRKDARFPAASLMLHAFKLCIRLPGESGRSCFRSPLPARFAEVLKVLARERVQE